VKPEELVVDENGYPPPKGPFARAAIALVRGYQQLMRPVLPKTCRYHPSCSDYGILAIRKYGLVKGSCLGFWRICRCHPFCRGGIDYP
jgi:putative membrane protein insertion efficiency factor